MKLYIGKYAKREINTIPIEYLIWYFNVIKRKKRKRSDTKKHLAILKYFLSFDNISVHKNSLSNKYGFYFDNTKRYDPDGNEMPFFETIGYINSKGEYVYEHRYFNDYYYIHKENNKFVLSDKYVTHTYLYFGHPLVYEKTNKYYFYDPYGKIFMYSFMIRPADLPDGLTNNFSKNIAIKNGPNS